MNLLTEEQAAARLQLKPSTLAAWRTKKHLKGRGPAFIQTAPYRTVRYAAEDLDRWVEKNRQSFNGD